MGVCGILQVYIFASSTRAEKVIKASWIIQRGPAKVDKVRLSRGLHQIEVSTPPPPFWKPLKQNQGGSISHLEIVSPTWGFTTGLRASGRAGGGGTGCLSLHQIMVQPRRANLSRRIALIWSPPLPPSLPISLSLPLFLSAPPPPPPPTQMSPPILLCLPSRLHPWQLQTLLAVIGSSSQPWNDPWKGKKKKSSK